ncbi:MAG: hypothetical protein H6Q65_201 [Firmicutes bacterium]|nr:hypothetical protein [Bacillota bacterium]
MTIYEKAIKDSNDWSMRKLLKQATVYDGTAAATFYYRDNPREIWNLTQHFPNLTPPCTNFFVNVTTPDKLVSREIGVSTIPVLNYGVWFTAVDVSNGLATEQQEAVREKAREMQYHHKVLAETVLQNKLQECGGDYCKVWDVLDKDEKNLLQIVKSLAAIIEKPIISQYVAHWILDGILFLAQQGKIKPVHTMTLEIAADGSIIYDEEIVYSGGIMMECVQSATSFRDVANQSRELEIFYHPALLAICTLNGYKLAL